MADKKANTAMDTALNYLTYRMRSESEIRTKLKQKGFSEEDTDGTISKLREYGYVDDRAFAAELVRSKRCGKPTGRRLLKQLLYKSGLDNDIIEYALLSYTEDEEQEACDMLFEKLLASKGNDKNAHAKIQRALLQRGFNYDIIRTSFRGISGDD